MSFNKLRCLNSLILQRWSYWRVLGICLLLSACASQKAKEPAQPSPEQIQMAVQAENDAQLFNQAIALAASPEASETELKTAKAIFEELYASNASYLGALANAADIDFRLKQYEQAEQTYKALLEAASVTQKTTDTSSEQAQTLNTEQTTKASGAENSAHKQQFLVHGLNQLGLLAREKGEFKQAEDYYRRALSIHPDQPEILRNLAILLDLYQGKLAEALELYKRYQSLLETEDPKVKDWIFDLKNRLPEASGNE